MGHELDPKNRSIKEPIPVIMMTGFSLSGKRDLAKKIISEFPGKLTTLSTVDIHNVINGIFPILKDDNTVDTDMYWLRQNLTTSLRKAWIPEFISYGVGLLLVSTHSTLEKRGNTWESIEDTGHEIKKVILHVDISEEDLYKRLVKADEEAKANGEKPPWVDLYERVQKPNFVPPTKDEADLFIRFNGSNEVEVIETLSSVFTK